MTPDQLRRRRIEQEIAAILRQTGAQKVNLIGHSQGGATARYVAGLHAVSLVYDLLAWDARTGAPITHFRSAPVLTIGVDGDQVTARQSFKNIFYT